MAIICKLTVSDNDEYQSNLHAENMNELIEKIKDWQSWGSMKESLEHFGHDKKTIKEIKDSGFYYDEKG